MATEFRIYDYPGGIAGEDFSSAGSLLGQNGGQYLFVASSGVLDTFVHYQNNFPLTNKRPAGISQNNPKNAGELAVRSLGRSKLTAGAAVSVGQEIGSDSAGRGVAKSGSQTGANLGDWVMGWAASAAGGVGELFSIELCGAYQV
jgi:hypothetical protein